MLVWTSSHALLLVKTGIKNWGLPSYDKWKKRWRFVITWKKFHTSLKTKKTENKRLVFYFFLIMSVKKNVPVRSLNTARVGQIYHFTSLNNNLKAQQNLCKRRWWSLNFLSTKYFRQIMCFDKIATWSLNWNILTRQKFLKKNEGNLQGISDTKWTYVYFSCHIQKSRDKAGWCRESCRLTWMKAVLLYFVFFGFFF